MGISQEVLAEELGLSVQAVSKWECGMSYPDITLLPQIADFLGISLDMLLRGEEMEKNETLSALPDDDTLRIVQCVGQKIVSKEELEHFGSKRKIPLFTDGSTKMSVEIWGSAEIDGDISGALNAGGAVTCADVSGGVSAGASVTCADVEGSVSSGSNVTCCDVNGNVSAGAGVKCGDVSGNVIAGGGVTCCDVSGNADGGGFTGGFTINMNA